MTVFNSYSTGTVTVTAGGTTVTGTGTTWSGINAKPGDDLVINGFTAVVMDVVDATHLTIKAWPFAAQTAQPYAVVWRSPLRYVGGQAMHDIDSLIAYLTGGVFPTISGGTAASSSLVIQSTSGVGTTDLIQFKTGSQVERLRIESGGGIVALDSYANIAPLGQGVRFNVIDFTSKWHYCAHTYGAHTAPGTFIFTKTRNAAPGSHTIVNINDRLAQLWFTGSDGAQFQNAAMIAAEVDAAPGAGSMPGRLMFLTTPSGSGSASERLRIDSVGNMRMTTTSANVGLRFNTQPNAAVSADPGGSGVHYNYFSGPDGQAYFFVGYGPTDPTIYANVAGGFGVWSPSFTNRSFFVDMSASGAVYFDRIGTTVSAANAFLDSTAQNKLLRVSSSLRYKRDTEPLDPALAEAALRLKPIWYRSRSEADNPQWSWYGYGAEDVAAEDPRLCHWTYADADFEIVEVPLTEDKTRQDRIVKAGAKLIPDSVMYDRVALLQIAALKARIEKLEQERT